MAQLTSDIVWLVEREVTLPSVNGQPATVQKALVPQLYARVTEGDLTGNGALLGGADVQMDAASVLNSGTVLGRKVVQINADTLANLGGDIQAQSIGITTAGDISNTGGSISAGQDLQLQAGGDITIASTASKGNGSASRSDRTDLTRVAGLYVSQAAGELIASAGGDINLIAGIVQSAGDASRDAVELFAL